MSAAQDVDAKSVHSREPAKAPGSTWLFLILAHAVAPLLLSGALLALILNVTGTGHSLDHGILSRNILVPPIIIIVTWNALMVIARAYRSRAIERQKGGRHGL